MATKTVRRAQQLAGAPLQGYFLAARVHPAVALLPTAVLMLAFLTGQFVLQLLATLLVLISLFLTLGRSMAITAEEIVVMQGWPPLWRPSKVVRRMPRTRHEVQRRRLYWRIDLDGEVLWVNKTFTDQVQLIADRDLDGDGPPPGAHAPDRTDPETAAVQRPRQVVSTSRRVTPKGSRGRAPRKYRR